MQLTQKDIYAIETYIWEGYRTSKIALKIGRNKSVLSRLFQKYPRESFHAETVIHDRWKKKSTCSSWHTRILPVSKLSGYILEKIQHGYSPEQVAGSWKKDTGEKISKDTVYTWIYESHPELVWPYFRRKGKKYRNRKQEKIHSKYQIQERNMIDTRPKAVDSKERIGDWEWDTIIGKNRSWAILTLVERRTGYLIACKLEEGKKAEWVTHAIQRVWNPIAKEKRKTLTVDNGREFADHRMITFFTETPVYFAHPYHSWERWTNENTNWLLREYIPKKTDFHTITQEMLDIFVERINSRPRKRLHYFTPSELFFEKSCVSD